MPAIFGDFYQYGFKWKTSYSIYLVWYFTHNIFRRSEWFYCVFASLCRLKAVEVQDYQVQIFAPYEFELLNNLTINKTIGINEWCWFFLILQEIIGQSIE